MNGKFSPGEKIDYLLTKQELPYIQLNQPAFEHAGINEQEAEDAIVAALPAVVATLPAQPPIHPPIGTPPPIVQATPPKPAPHARKSRTAAERKAEQQAAETPPPPPPTPQPLQAPASKVAPHPSLVEVFTRLQLASGSLPPDEFGTRLAHSYSPNGGWYVMLIPPAYQMVGNAAGTGATHFSAWSYDRHVPLGFYGAPFQPGIYYGRVAPVDFAATFAALLGVNQPSAAVGHILTQALKPVAATPETALTPKATRHVRHGAASSKGSAGTDTPGTDAPGTDTPGGVTPP
jgi:hypothetical protein